MRERLHKVLAHAGVASRRAAERMIREHRVRVNGTLVLELGTQVDPTCDQIEVDGRPLHGLGVGHGRRPGLCHPVQGSSAVFGRFGCVQFAN